jgi:mannose-1-phosphate guanylyltransferase
VIGGLERHAPQIVNPLRDAISSGRPLDEAYADLPAMSIDRALLEPGSLEGSVKVVPAEFGWSDVGSWNALHAELARLEPAQSDVLAIGRNEDVGSERVLVHSSTGRLVVTIGLRGTIVVDTPDVLLVCDTDRAQDVRQVVDRLVQAKETEYL